MEELFWVSSADAVMMAPAPTEEPVTISGGEDLTDETDPNGGVNSVPDGEVVVGVSVVVGDKSSSSSSGSSSGSGSSSSSSSGNSSGGNGTRGGGNDNDSRGVVSGVSTTNVGSNNTSSGGNDTDLSRYITSTRNTSGTSTASTAAQTVGNLYYVGGNQVIGNYTSGQKIIFGAMYTGANFDGAGNFIVGSNLGALAIQNARDKIIDLSDGAGNTFVTAYEATNPGVIDFRIAAGYEIISGSAAGADVIYAGNGSSQMWGGWDNAADIFVGGAGNDIFMCRRFFGGDAVLNAAANDVVNLTDSTLSDIVATASDGMGTVGIAFNTGNVVTFQSSEPLSAAVVLADGSSYRFNHVTKSWQGA